MTKRPSKQLIKEVKEVIDPTIKIRKSLLRQVFNEYKEEIKLVKQENERLREIILELKEK